MLCVLLSLCVCVVLASDAPIQTPAAHPLAAKAVLAVHKGISLDVEVLAQYPQLPNGCEATSLAAVLRFLGFDVEALDLVYGYIPSEPITYSEDGFIAYGPDPAEAYAGWPEEGYTGFYCFAPPIVQAANSYLSERQSLWQAVDASGADEEELLEWLDTGVPVIVWATLNMDVRLFSNFQWTLPNGEVYYPYSNLHCMVLTGYDDESFTIMDPIEGLVTVDRERFMSRYWSIGEWAVAFAKKA